MARTKANGGSGLSVRVRIILFCLTFVVYIAIFLIRYFLQGEGLPTAAIIPVVGAGLLFGLVPGIAAGLLSIPFNIALHEFMGLDWGVMTTGGGMAGSVAMVLIGAIMGRLRDLQVRVSLELGRRLQVEKQLEKHRDQLEVVVHERTSELRELNTELRHLRNLLKNVIDSMPSVLVGVDVAGRVIQWNREAEEVTEISAAEAQGKQLAKVFPLLAGEMGKVHLAIREHEVQESIRIMRDGEGERRFRDVTVYPLEVNGIEGAVIRVDDVTERIRLEEMIIQSEKMLSVGGLAAGMAHEINNPLAGIIQNVQVLRNRYLEATPKNEQIAEASNTHMEAIRAYTEQRGQLRTMDHIMDSAVRAAEIVENMLSFSRKSEFEFELHDLGNIVDNAIELATKKYDLGKKQDFRQIEIVRDYQDDLPPVPCERTKIQQVILNLLVNGAEAMAGRVNGDESSQMIVRLRREKAMACIEVQDNGPGMSEKIKKRVFEPFYSTKGVGQGTGLGLSISYFIVVDHHQGTMEVESDLGEGTTFFIRLPIKRAL
jgi:PAS domain S-box-containing protein